MVDDMRVYIANLGEYNEGELVGDWFSFPIDEEDVAERIGLNSYYEEYAVHDTDNFPIEIGEYISIQELNEMYEMICELPDYITDALDEFVSHYGSLEEVYEHKDDIYFYPDCDDMTDIAYYFIDELQVLGEIPLPLQNYIDSGIRVIPMTQEVQKAFEEQRKINFMLAKDKSYEVDGYSGFVFTAKSGRPLMPYGVNSVLYNIVDAYNKAEVQKAKKEHRKAELLPKVSAHVMRHTACTRMAECRMDIKVLQYIMGHAHFDVTMEVYNHLGDRARIENEIAKLDSMAVNF